MQRPSLTDSEFVAAAEAFLDALYAANETANLTRVPREDAWERHILDSVLMEDLMPEGSRVLDIGTGPGLPAWPLARLRPDLRVTALDSNQKMLAFLRSQPLKNLKVVAARAEEFGHAGQFDVITGRALAPLAIQLELSALPCQVKGRVIPMRTAAERAEIEALPRLLGLELEQIVERSLPSGVVRLFPVYRKAEMTPRGFPRRWAEIRKRPPTN